ncbi:ABC transporter permease [Caryophanon tenue]|uniref:ABC transporter permease n=1 Tax=Caryophanon tenue TaxID=33978 RepID=A0A1C0YNE7_9BACL|nr:ABC transporter permease [Caryophanon tenue]OCS88683.1 ABC transporter permease [Caryophanon tenue]
MLTGKLERAFHLAEKHRIDVNTVTELTKIIEREVNMPGRVEEKVLLQMLSILENNKHILKEAT